MATLKAWWQSRNKPIYVVRGGAAVVVFTLNAIDFHCPLLRIRSRVKHTVAGIGVLAQRKMMHQEHFAASWYGGKFRRDLPCRRARGCRETSTFYFRRARRFLAACS